METKEINNNAPLRVTEALQYHNILTLENDNKLNDYLESEVKRILEERFQRMRDADDLESLPTQPIVVEFVFTIIDIYGNYQREIKGTCACLVNDEGVDLKGFSINKSYKC